MLLLYMDLPSNDISVSTSSSSHPPVEDVQPVYHSSTEGIHRVELSTQARGLLLLLLLLLLLEVVVVVVVGGEGDAVGGKVGVGVELAGVEGREVSGQALPSQESDVAEQLVNLTIGNSSVQWQCAHIT